MKRQQFCGPRSGKLVFQLPEGVTFAYDICLGHLRDCWKGLAKEYNSGIGPGYAFVYLLGRCEAKKMSFNASKWHRKFRTRKIVEKWPN